MCPFCDHNLFVMPDSLHRLVEDELAILGKRSDKYPLFFSNKIYCNRGFLQLLDRVETVKLEHIPRSANKVADVLANLAATLVLGRYEHYCSSLWAMGRYIAR